MHLCPVPQCTIQNRNSHISAPYGVHLHTYFMICVFLSPYTQCEATGTNKCITEAFDTSRKWTVVYLCMSGCECTTLPSKAKAECYLHWTLALPLKLSKLDSLAMLTHAYSIRTCSIYLYLVWLQGYSIICIIKLKFCNFYLLKPWKFKLIHFYNCGHLRNSILHRVPALEANTYSP